MNSSFFAIVFKAYQNSKTRNALCLLLLRMRKFFVRNIGIEEVGRQEALKQSSSLKFLLKIYRNINSSLVFLLKESEAAKILREFKREENPSILSSAGIVVVVSILTEALLSFLLQRHIDLLGVILRILFFFVGLLALLSEASWEEVKNTSILFRYLNNRCKIKK